MRYWEISVTSRDNKVIVTDIHQWHCQRPAYIIVAWWRHMASEILINLVSSNGLLPDGRKPLPQLILTSARLGGIQLRLISQLEPKLSFCTTSLKIIFSKLLLHLSGVNELTKNWKPSVLPVFLLFSTSLRLCESNWWHWSHWCT